MSRWFTEITIPGLPKMANPSGAKSTHWRYAHQESQKWKSLVAVATAGKRPKEPLKRFRLSMTRYSSVEPDYDGLVRGFKHVVDGLKACGIIEDDKLSNSCGAWQCYWTKCKPKEGKIHIFVVEHLDPCNP